MSSLVPHLSNYQQMTPTGTLLLTRHEVASLFSIEDCISAVEGVFKLHGEGKTEMPGILGIHATKGGFHIKAGVLKLQRPFFAAKINANFPQNPKLFGLPLIQGVIVLCDGETGYPLAVMDSIEITILRTGAATAVAARYLARPNSTSVTVCGCGNQGAVSLRALSKLYSLRYAFAYDIDNNRAREFARKLSPELRIEITPTTHLQDVLSVSDICVTCTPAKTYFVKRENVLPGMFIAAVGADNEDKQELDPALFTGNKIVVDLLDQCATIGELHHALEQKVVTTNDVYAELGDVVAGSKRGRTSAEEITIFDSTGMALQDVVAAAAVYEKAVMMGKGRLLNFNV
ncbi:MAG TPA: ornithine cyclodeaminase family protein [Pyrinomonadaceae bacterium]